MALWSGTWTRQGSVRAKEPFATALTLLQEAEIILTDAKKPYFGQVPRATSLPTSQPSFKFNYSAGVSLGARAAGHLPPLPDDAAECNTQGNAWLLAHRPADAVRAYERAIALKPDYVDPHFNRGNALLRLQRNEDALASFERAITLAPGLALAHYNRGTILQALNQASKAMESYRTVLQMDPENALAHFNLGCIHLQMKQFDEALACMDQVIKRAPELPEAHHNRGTALLRLGRDAEAVTSLTQAIGLKPQYAEAYNNRGEAQLRLKDFRSALADINRAIELQPKQGESRWLMGRLLREMKRYEEALPQLYLAQRLSAQIPMLAYEIIAAKVYGCIWQDIDQDIAHLQQEIRAGQPVLEPFLALSLFDEPALHQETARLFGERDFPASAALGPLAVREGGGKIRVGYYSADFRNHAVSHLIAELLEVHDRERFEWFAFSVGPDTQDGMRQRVMAGVDHFVDVRERSDIDIARLSRELGIDIAVDLMGFTGDSRLGSFSYRCAPVQASYLGYPGTTGARYMDYVIADKVVIPPQSRAHFTEKVVYLPHSYQVNDSQRKISERIFSREELGLPATGFVFCCFNNNFKIMPQTFDGWMRILQAVEGSVLWLLEDNPIAAKNLRREAEARGVAATRLVFAQRMSMDQHLARQRLADLFLDTLPYNAHTTASDALWAGLPVLTCMGESFASRVAASLLCAVGLPELVSDTQADFEARAIELARDAAQLGGLRDRLRSQGRSAPLFDARLFARHIESAYSTMYERLRQGQAPDVIEV